MSARMSRRQIMAAVLLAGDPVAIRHSAENDRLMIEFDTIAAARTWLTAVGLDSPHLRKTQTISPETGVPHLWAWADWYGWKISVSATDPVPVAPAALDTQTAAALTDLVEGGAS